MKLCVKNAQMELSLFLAEKLCILGMNGHHVDLLFTHGVKSIRELLPSVMGRFNKKSDFIENNIFLIRFQGGR